jgi:hypothetical protein
MRPIDFPGSNIKMRPPKGWEPDKDGVCHTVPAHNDGRNVTTVWALSPDERERIAKGENIALTCVGGMPPVWLMPVALRGEVMHVADPLRDAVENFIKHYRNDGQPALGCSKAYKAMVEALGRTTPTS